MRYSVGRVATDEMRKEEQLKPEDDMEAYSFVCHSSFTYVDARYSVGRVAKKQPQGGGGCSGWRGGSRIWMLWVHLSLQYLSISAAQHHINLAWVMSMQLDAMEEGALSLLVKNEKEEWKETILRKACHGCIWLRDWSLLFRRILPWPSRRVHPWEGGYTFRLFPRKCYWIRQPFPE